MIGRSGILILSILFSTSLAQDLTLSAFLLSANADATVSGFNGQIDWFSRERYKLPWVNELEFRTLNNVMINGRQQYRLRAEIANPFQVRNSNRYFSIQQDLFLIRKRVALKEAFANRYLMAVEWLAIYEKLELAKRAERFASRRLTIMEQLAGTAGFKADDYMDARVDALARRVDRQEIEAELNLIENSMGGVAGRPGANVVRPNKIIRPETIALLADTLTQETTTSGVSEQVKTIELAKQGEKLDRSRINFGWVQGMYAPYRTGTEEHPTGFAMGITIPIFNKNKDDIARSELKSLEEQAQLDEVKAEHIRQRAFRMASLKSQLELFARSNTWIDSLSLLGSGKSYVLARSLDPLSEVRWQQQLLRLEFVRREIRYRILEEWIRLLDEMDLLAVDPWINLLSDELKPLD